MQTYARQSNDFHGKGTRFLQHRTGWQNRSQQNWNGGGKSHPQAGTLAWLSLQNTGPASSARAFKQGAHSSSQDGKPGS